jgi:predicted ATPase
MDSTSGTGRVEPEPARADLGSLDYSTIANIRDRLGPMARLLSVRIAGWKSIRDMEPKLELGSVNVFIGANGSGKTNFVSFFKMMSELAGRRFQDYIARSGGVGSVLHHGLKVTRDIEAQLEFELENLPYRYNINFTYALPDLLIFRGENLGPIGLGSTDHSQTMFAMGFHVETSLTRLNESGQFAPIDRTIKGTIQLLSEFRVFRFYDTSETAQIRQPGYIEANQYLYSDGGNLAAMLYLYQQTKPLIYRRIVATVRHIMPEFDDFVLEPQRLNPKNILLNWRQKGSEYAFGPHQLSDGTLRAIAMMTLFLQPVDDLPAVIVVDEPELGLHPHAIEIIAGLIRAASLKSQVILTTQSTTFLDQFEPEEIIVVDDEKGHSVFRRLDVDQLKDWLEDYSVSQLWQKNVLGGGPLS